MTLNLCNLKRLARDLLVLITILLGFARGSENLFAAPALQPIKFTTRAWLREDGLPQNAVTSVIQTRDGYIWVGTYNGLARFDGVRFVTFNTANTPQLRSGRITCLSESRDGVLWIGHEGGEVTRFEQGQFTSVPLTVASGKIMDVREDDLGDAWLVNAQGLLIRLRDSRVLIPENGRLSGLVNLCRSPEGKIWVMREGRVSELARGELKVLPLNVGSDNALVIGIGSARDGGLWVAADDRLQEWKDGVWTQSRGTNMLAGTPAGLTELNGNVIAATTSDKGIFLNFPNDATLQMNRSSGFSSDWITGLCQDREGNLWIATGGAGLLMVRESNLSTITSPDKWQGRAVLSVAAEPGGGLWAGTEGAGLYHFDGGVWTNYSVPQGIENPYVWSVVHNGTELWAGSWSGGLFVLRGERFQHPSGTEKLLMPMPALLPSRDGALWVGTGDGLMRYQTNGTISWFGKDHKPKPNDVRCIAEQADGTIWFGTAGNGLFQLTSTDLKQFQKADGLASDFVQCLRVDGGTLWIGSSGGGLGRLQDGHFSTVNSSHGLTDDVICHIEDDGLGFFWCSSFNGIFRVSKSELNACADRKIETVHCHNYGISDGMPTLECSGGFQPAGGRQADGTLLFSTSRGLVVIDPARVKTNPLAPPVVIEQLRVDGKRVELAERGEPVKISPGRHQFEFQYAALSYVAPERVQFKCWLSGLDPDWKSAGTKRSITFNYLEPKPYEFRVTACNNDGLWNETPAALAFIVLPYFWQTVWFQSAAVIGLVLAASSAVWYAMRRRMVLKLERIERQRAIERERTRIANDIHDDLGARLTRISLLTDSVPVEEAGPRAAEVLENIFSTTREITQAMDEIVWAVNPKHDTLDSLVLYAGKFAQEFLETAGVRCRLDIPLELPNWPVEAEVRHNLFLAFKECLNNVLRHAQATEVHVSLSTDANSFTLMVADNGIGFDVENSAGLARLGSGNGLANMRQRLAQIGGRCLISSRAGTGTRVEFFVNANRK